MIIVLFGKPTCGKGTISKMLEKDGYFVLGGSDVLRENSRTKTAKYYNEAQHALTTGILISSELLNKMMTEKVSTIDNPNIVVDGYPRKIKQAEHLLTLFPPEKIRAFYLDVSDEEVEERIINRLVCRDCSAPFSRKEPMQPKKEGVCDHCGGELYQRVDDTAETIKVRLNEFNVKTLPVLEYLKEHIDIINIPDLDSQEQYDFVLKNL